MLDVAAINAGYGASQVLFGVSLSVVEGEVVTLLGRNGMGKSTTVRAILGLLPITAGSIAYQGQALQRLPSHRIARLGIGLVPEGRQIFANLTVRENLLATAANSRGVKDPFNLEAVFALFPRLAERLRHYGNQLSGGEQQMLAIGRALMINPSLLVLDEATEGLAPLIRREIWQALTTLKERGLSILVIDKNVDALLAIADRHYLMEKGQVVWSGTSDELRRKPELKSRYLGLEH
jgi:branched-chain amino acid transport system ATP-binding protein